MKQGESKASEVDLAIGDEIEVLENGRWERVTVYKLHDDWGFGYRSDSLVCGCARRDNVVIRLIDGSVPGQRS